MTPAQLTRTQVSERDEVSLNLRTVVPDVVFSCFVNEPTGRSQLLDAFAVAALIGKRGVEPVALHFDDGPQGTVDEVDPPDPVVLVADVDLANEVAEAHTPSNRLESALEATSGSDVSERPIREQRTHRSYAGPALARQLFEHGGESRDRREPRGQRVVERSLRSSRSEDRREIEDRSRRTGGRDAVEDQHVLRSEESRLVNHTDVRRAAAAPFSMAHDVDGSQREAGKPPSRGGRVMIDHGFRAEIQRGERDPLLGRVGNAD